MKVFAEVSTRSQYIATQIARSRSKFRYCKVSIHDVFRYGTIVRRDRMLRRESGGLGPALCLGTRSGREVDLFRIGLFGTRLRQRAVRLLEIKRNSFLTLAPPLEAAGRSDLTRLGPSSAIGVEINPDAARRDVWIGSFDAMPAEWATRFGVVFSNSFDQSQDPHRTAAEWRRVTRPGGYLVVCFAPGAEPSVHDPVGQLAFDDMRELFGGEVVYYQHRGSRKGYSEVILKRPGGGTA